MSDERRTPPDITDSRVVAKSRLFAIEEVELRFSNGNERVFERMYGSGRGAVMIVALTDDDHLLLIREYCAGTHDYQLGFPKGLIDPGEEPEVSAVRELKEEVGVGANQLTPLKMVTMAPAFFKASMHIFVARDLYEEKLEGDEPEELEVVRWPLAKWQELLAQPDFTEARSVAALFMAIEQLKGER